jgi:hypothetical protein
MDGVEKLQTFFRTNFRSGNERFSICLDNFE